MKTPKATPPDTQTGLESGSVQRPVGHPSHCQRLPEIKNKRKNRPISFDTPTINGYGLLVMSEAQ